jgi:hypothetical protein
MSSTILLHYLIHICHIFLEDHYHPRWMRRICPYSCGAIYLTDHSPFRSIAPPQPIYQVSKFQQVRNAE